MMDTNQQQRNDNANKNKLSIDAFDRQWLSKQDGQVRTGSFSGSCDAQVSFFIEERINTLIREFKIAKGKKILHCGCGTGQWSIPFALNGYHITNIDLSEAAISLTRESFSKLGLEGEFRVADILNLPYDDGYFDIVMSFGVLEHFEDIAPPVSEMCRVLKQGGLFHADVIPKRYSARTIEQFLQSLFTLFYNIFKLRFTQLGRCVSPFRPDFYENSIPINNYVSVLTSSNMGQVRVFGVRAYPFIVLPRFLDNAYAFILKLLKTVWFKFDNSGSVFSIKWGVIFTLFAVKK